MMKCKVVAACWAALGPCAISLSPVAAAAADPAPPTLGTWLEGEFFTIGDSCLGNLKRPSAGKTAVPSDVRAMSTIASNMNRVPEISPETSVRGLFATVYKGGRVANYQPIGTAFNESSANILYENRSNLTVAHNCTTMFSGAASTDFKLNIDQLRFALSASYSTNTTQTAYAYAGRLISPITGTLNLNSSVVEAPPINPLAVWLSLWQFYRTNPAAVADAPNLQLLNEIDGVAMQRYKGLTQTTLLNGMGSAALSVPFFSSTAKTEASANIRQALKTESFSIAYWSPTYVQMPQPSEVANAVPRFARFLAVGDNPKNFVSGATRSFAWDVEGVPSAYCNPLVWSLAAPSGSQTSENASLANLSISPTPNVIQSCRFSADVTPPSAVSSSAAINVTLNLLSNLSAAAGAGTPELKLSVSNSVQDFRASVAFRSGSGPASVTFAGDNTSVTIAYPIRESNGFRATGIAPNSADIRLTCVGMQDRTLAPSSVTATYSSSVAGPLMTLGLTLPGDLTVGEGVSAQCNILGEVTVIVATLGERALAFPSYALTIKRAAARVAANAVVVQDE